MIGWLKDAFVWFVWWRLKYIVICHLGWNCKRNFTSTYGCIHCGRSGYETLKGRRYYGAQHCRDVLDAMRRNRAA